MRLTTETIYSNFSASIQRTTCCRRAARCDPTPCVLFNPVSFSRHLLVFLARHQSDACVQRGRWSLRGCGREQVILIDSSVSAYSAYSLMAANEQQSVPVWDSRADRYCGTLTTTDLLQLIELSSESKEHESRVIGMWDMDLDHFIHNYSRPPWGEQVCVRVCVRVSQGSTQRGGSRSSSLHTCPSNPSLTLPVSSVPYSAPASPPTAGKLLYIDITIYPIYDISLYIRSTIGPLLCSCVSTYSRQAWR